MVCFLSKPPSVFIFQNLLKFSSVKNNFESPSYTEQRTVKFIYLLQTKYKAVIEEEVRVDR